MTRKSPAQMLFDRLVRTWIVPEVRRRTEQSGLEAPISLWAALIVWEKQTAPSVYLNEEVMGRVRTVQMRAARAFPKGEAITPNHISGIADVGLDGSLGRPPLIYVCQGINEQYYVLQKRTEAVLDEAWEFRALKDPLGHEGLVVAKEESLLNLSLDLQVNQYRGTPAEKRKVTTRFREEMLNRVRGDIPSRVRRQLRLPPHVLHHDEDVVPLLLEARAAYVDGHFLSAIAAAATTADRVCNTILFRYPVAPKVRKQIVQGDTYTLGRKIDRMRGLKVLSPEQANLLRALNRLRNRHIHPKGRVSDLTLKRDARQAVVLLHQLLDTTHSVFRDYVIRDGRLEPRPLA